jgi:hypothetical protein
MDIEHARGSIARLAALIDDARIEGHALRTMFPQVTQEHQMLSIPRQMSLLITELEDAQIRLHYVAGIVDSLV